MYSNKMYKGMYMNDDTGNVREKFVSQCVKSLNKFHDFSRFFGLFPNSIIFPGLEKVFFHFPGFHDFSRGWKPCQDRQMDGRTDRQTRQIP